MDKREKEAKEIRERVRCGYLDISYGVISFGEDLHETPSLIECHNRLCGPKHGCDVYEGRECQYRSTNVKPEFLYDLLKEMLESDF